MIAEQIISYILIAVTFVANFFGFGFDVNKDTVDAYKDRMHMIEIYENDLETALPMTKIHSIIQDHLNAPLPKGKTEKKVLVLGYDGCRADSMIQLPENKLSSIRTVLDDGGYGYIAYCGGVNYPGKPIQKTSTAPGWCSMLTGKWADEHGITGNGQVKSNKYLTILTSDVEKGLVDSSAFYVSWDGHFVDDNSTYKDELNYISEKKLDVTFKDASSDVGTFSNVMKDVRSKDCTDFIFSIFEYCDHTGHASGFGENNFAYKYAFKSADKAGYEIIKAVKSRETFDTEDWLIIITSDHGGYDKDHGGDTLQERYMFIIANKKVK